MRSKFVSYYEHDGKEGYLEIEMCPVCKYVFKQFTPRDFYADKVILKGSQPFISLLDDEKHEKEYDGIERFSKYACPRCGVIQIDVAGDFTDDEC